ncbi:MAG: SMI1/KNR4 family protein [Verrucomicrobiota bacterium]
MNAEELARIEEELSVSLPLAYREIVLRPEFQGEAAGFMEFTGDADELIGLNLEARKEGFFGVKWPEHYLIIGEDGAGNSYFTDLKREHPAVFLADYELTTNKRRLVTNEGYETFADFLAFIGKLQSETDAAFAEDERPEAGKKPWWKLW